MLNEWDVTHRVKVDDARPLCSPPDVFAVAKLLVVDVTCGDDS